MSKLEELFTSIPNSQESEVILSKDSIRQDSILDTRASSYPIERESIPSITLGSSALETVSILPSKTGFSSISKTISIPSTTAIDFSPFGKSPNFLSSPSNPTIVVLY
jgi:hypothetical protein